MDGNSIDNFTFSLTAAKHSMKDLDLQINAIEHRLSHIASKVEVQGVPVLKHILSLTMDEKELERLGKALLKVAPAASELTELQKKKQVVEFSVNKPEWMASTFADFTQEVEDIISMKDES